MSFYSDMATVARDLLSEFGQTISIKRSTGNVIDPITGAVTAGTTQTLSAKGVLKPYPDNMIDGTRILSSDREVTLEDTVEPLATDKITIGTQDWSIINIVTVNPAGTKIVYRVQVRR